MSADVGRVPALRNGAVWIWGAVGVDLLGAIVLVVALALLAFHAGLNLCSNTDAVTDLDCGNLGSNLDGLANDLMTDAQGERHLTPTASDAVDVGAADTAAFDFDVDIIVFEGLGFELGRMSGAEQARVRLLAYVFLLEIGPVLLVLDHKTFKRIWITHGASLL
jgi:hypothetical protein